MSVETIGVLGVLEDALQRPRGGGLERRVDLLGASSRATTVAVRSTTEPVMTGARTAKPCELALQLGQHEADRLRGAGGGRDQVHRGRAGAAQVLVRHVLQALVGRVGVDRGHQAVLDADGLVQDLGHRREAVRRARRVGDDVVLVLVVGLVEVDAERDGDVLALGRRGDQDLLGPGLEVLGGVVALGEQAGGLDDDVGAEIAPRQVRRVALGQDPDRVAVDGDALVAVLDGAGERPVGRVVAEQVGQRRRDR